MVVLDIKGMSHTGKTTGLIAIAKNLDNCLFITREEKVEIVKNKGIENVIERPLFKKLDLEALLSMIDSDFDNVVIDGIHLPEEDEDVEFMNDSDINFFISSQMLRIQYKGKQ